MDKKLKTKNFLVAACVVGLIVIFYLITIARITEGLSAGVGQ